VKVRLTVYWGHTKTASGQKPVHMKTCAAEKRFKFGTKITIPSLGMELTVNNRGPAVEKRVASRGKYPVIDVFFNSRQQALSWNKRVYDNGGLIRDVKISA
jgi:3D (Asp-Asp-Asp) domain-containing protein